MGKLLLEIDSLSFSYPECQGITSGWILSELNHELAEGEIQVIFGSPDSGKTTLSRLLLGLLPRYYGGKKQGSVAIDGIDVERWSSLELSARIGVAFQEPEEQIIMSRCDSEVALLLESRGIEPAEMEVLVTEALDWMGLSRFRNRNPATLSGGQQKKLILAVLHAQSPAIWVLDEILEGLDTPSQIDLLQTMADRKHTGVILASKFFPILNDYPVKCFLLHDGKLESLGTPKQAILDKRLSDLEPRLSTPRRSTPTSSAPLLRVQGLQFKYPGENGGDGFSVEVPELYINSGETLGIVGENGSGKSTLSRLLCGLLAPTDGAIELFDSSVEGWVALNESDRLSRISMLLQSPDYQLFLPTLREELLYGLAANRAEHRVAEAIRLFDLPAESAPPSLLGYGARKRIQWALSFMQPRKIAILDESESGLTYAQFNTLYSIIRQEYSSVVIITHNRPIVTSLCDRQIEMKGGMLLDRVKEE